MTNALNKYVVVGFLMKKKILILKNGWYFFMWKMTTP